MLVAIIFVKANAQCNTNPIYNDMVAWVQNSSHAIRMQATLVNTALPDGSHFYTAWGKEDFIFNGPPTKGLITNRCRFISSKPISLLFSDREQTFISNLLQPFTLNQPDKIIVSIDVANNSIISESKTWKFTTVYKNVIRKGNILYAFSGGSMIVLNLFFVDNTSLNY